jgi:hypothetical protein
MNSPDSESFWIIFRSPEEAWGTIDCSPMKQSLAFGYRSRDIRNYTSRQFAVQFNKAP